MDASGDASAEAPGQGPVEQEEQQQGDQRPNGRWRSATVIRERLGQLATVVALALLVAVLVAWWRADWTWWGPIWLVGGLIVLALARPVVRLLARGARVAVPARRGDTGWRDQIEQLGVIALLVVVWLVLSRYLSIWAQLLSVGTAVAVVAGVMVWRFWGRRTRPRWVRPALVGVAVVLVVAGAGGEWLAWRDLEDRRAENARAEREQRIAELRPRSPGEAARTLIEAVAMDRPIWACFQSTPRAQQQLAAAAGAASCEQAIHAFHRQVQEGKRGLYGEASWPSQDLVTAKNGDQAWVSACHLYATRGLATLALPGPQLGTLTLARDRRYRNAWWMVGFTPCDAGRPPGMPEPPEKPEQLPTYARAVGSQLAEAIAEKDVTVCRLFTGAGADSFAARAGGGAATCEDAVAALHAQVIDAEAYAAPSPGAREIEQPDGTTLVDVCHLEWSRWPEGDIVAGPQIGMLRLVQPDPDRLGWKIDAVTAC